MDVDVLLVPQMPKPCVLALSIAMSIALWMTTMPAFLFPLRHADSCVSCSTWIGDAAGSRAMPFVVTLMMPWLFPLSCAYIMTSSKTAVSSSS